MEIVWSKLAYEHFLEILIYVCLLYTSDAADEL